MKFVFFFFSIYLVVLSCVPCSDSADTHAATEISVSSTNSHNDHSDETCTPFCACACCSIAVVHHQQVKAITITPVIFSASYFLKQDNNSCSINNSIWQPPRLIA